MMLIGAENRTEGPKERKREKRATQYDGPRDAARLEQSVTCARCPKKL
jgi:hypothetical protein